MTEITELVSLLDEVGPALLSEDDGAGLTALCEIARLATDAAACSMSALDDRAGELRYIAASGAGADQIVGTRLPLGQGIAGFVASSGQGLSVSEVRRDPRFAQDVALSTGYVPTAMLAVPIRHRDDTLGVLSILDAGRPDLTLAAELASLAAQTMRRATTTATLGRVAAGALAAQTDSSDLADALRRAADSSSGESADLAELAAFYVELSHLGTDDRAAATRIVSQFTAHAAGSQQRMTVRRTRR
jgi:signal transduction protein with GAF and PtsI domain